MEFAGTIVYLALFVAATNCLIAGIRLLGSRDYRAWPLKRAFRGKGWGIAFLAAGIGMAVLSIGAIGVL